MGMVALNRPMEVLLPVAASERQRLSDRLPRALYALARGAGGEA